MEAWIQGNIRLHSMILNMKLQNKIWNNSIKFKIFFPTDPDFGFVVVPVQFQKIVFFIQIKLG